jgi:hypothetical protein
VVDDPWTGFKNDLPQWAALDLQSSALAHDGQDVIPDRQRAFIAGGHDSEVHVLLAASALCRKKTLLAVPAFSQSAFPARSCGPRRMKRRHP